MQSLKFAFTAGLMSIAAVLAAPSAGASSIPPGAEPIACFFAWPEGYTVVYLLDGVLYEESSETCPLDFP